MLIKYYKVLINFLILYSNIYVHAISEFENYLFRLLKQTLFFYLKVNSQSIHKFCTNASKQLLY